MPPPGACVLVFVFVCAGSWLNFSWFVAEHDRGCRSCLVLSSAPACDLLYDELAISYGVGDLLSVGHPMAKCKSVIGKVPPKDGSHINEKENKAPSLNQVYKLKQVPPQLIRSTTPSVPTTNAFELTSWADAFSDSGDEPADDDYANDFGKDEWPPLQGEGSSKPSNEFDDTPYTGHQSNIMAMIPFESSSALTTAQRNLNLVASQPNVLETTD
ncbi:hypothetical protein FNV43_RR07400 [Rhamnella rubrinervis]|uniref:Uncharacterized protein n=1 Tax=Rhamnella rubrinervis TaxID=2594499 RepID=A0A8K0HGG0_9ROSA|nr:hypothetical protein FNV43_RR07400 [Rhamnella rubrinervis]